MRNLFKQTLAGSMIAGAALLVAACGGGTETETENLATANELGTDPLLDAQTNDVTAIDATTNGALDTEFGGTAADTTTNGSAGAAETNAVVGETDGGDTGGNTVTEDTIGM